MIPEYFAIVSALVSSTGGLYYLYKTITGKTRPNRTTWLLWGLLPMIAFVAQRAQGVEAMSWITFAAGLISFLIVLASFLNKKAYWKTKPRDYYIAAGAICGITLWLVTDNPNLAILFMLAADFLASLPTILKSYQYPETESWVAYAISTLGFGIGMLSIQSYTFENSAFVIYLFVVSGLLTILAARKQKRTRTAI